MRAAELVWMAMWASLTKTRKIEDPQRTEVYEKVYAYYDTGDRFYHNFDHIEEMVVLLSQQKWGPGQTFSMWQTVFAAFMHDAYDPKHPDAERLSADLAEEVFANIPVVLHSTEYDAFIRNVRNMILCTANHQAETVAEHRLVDADLMRFCVGPWEKWAQQIREEYNEHSDEKFDAGRKIVLERFFSRRPFYSMHTEGLDDFKAYTNIKAQLAELEPTPVKPMVPLSVAISVDEDKVDQTKNWIGTMAPKIVTIRMGDGSTKQVWRVPLREEFLIQGDFV